MKIIGIETLLTNHPLVPHSGHNRWLWVRIYTDEGLVGLGETFPDGFPEAACIHGTLSRVLLNRNPLDIEALWWDMFTSFNYYGWAGAEIRALSIIDMALWDIAGKHLGLPLYQLLGGKVRNVPVYNTCYDREFDLKTQAGDLAELLLNQKIGMMKIWPFDRFVTEHRGIWISDDDIRSGMKTVQQIRERVGDKIQIAIEGHGYWDLNSARRISRALEPYDISWLEDMLAPTDWLGHSELAQSTSIPLCLSERLMTRWQYAPILRERSAKIIMLDVAWTGGISEARRICGMAESEHLPVTFHNCGGPVLCSATAHLATATHNLLNVESVRPYFEEYSLYAHGYPRIREGFLVLSDAPGLGVALSPELANSPDLLVQQTGIVEDKALLSRKARN